MYPTLLFFDDMYVYMMLIGIAMCFYVYSRISKKHKMPRQAYDFFYMLTFIAILSGIVSAMLFQFVYRIFEKGWEQAVADFGGMTFLGGLIGGAAAFLIGTRYFAKPEYKKEFSTVLAAFPACVTIAHFFGRLGCFFSGCCFGMEYDGFLSVTMPAGSPASWEYTPYGASPVNVLPTQLIEAIFLLILFVICYKFSSKSLPIYLLSYGVFRFIIEFFRGDDRGEFLWQTVLSPSQILSLAMVAVGAVVLFFMVRKHLKGKPASVPADTADAAKSDAQE